MIKESQFENSQISSAKKLGEIKKEKVDFEKETPLSQVIDRIAFQEMPFDIESLLKRKPSDFSIEELEEIKEKESQFVEMGKESYSDFEKTRSTFRSLEEICRVLGLEKEEFKNKTVLDIGSGYGGLALDISNIPELKTQVVSLDPRYTKEYFQKSLTVLRKRCEKAGIEPPETMEELAKLKEKFNVTEPVTLLDTVVEL